MEGLAESVIGSGVAPRLGRGEVSRSVLRRFVVRKVSRSGE